MGARPCTLVSTRVRPLRGYRRMMLCLSPSTLHVWGRMSGGRGQDSSTRAGEVRELASHASLASQTLSRRVWLPPHSSFGQSLQNISPALSVSPTLSTRSRLHHSLVPRPLPDFISQLQDEIWEWPGDEANYIIFFLFCRKRGTLETGLLLR